MRIEDALKAANLWIGDHQFLVVSVVVPVLSAFIAWRGVIGANRSLEASLEFQRNQAILNRRLDAFKEARDALADVSAILVDASQSLESLGINARRDDRARVKEKIEDLQRRFYHALFRYNQITSATLPLTKAFQEDIHELKKFTEQPAGEEGAEVKTAEMGQMQFPALALVALRKAGEEIEGLHI
jgi:hypothetical protein